MFIQEYSIYVGWNSLPLPPTATYMCVREKFGNLYAYFMVEEDDFGAYENYQIEVCHSSGTIPEGARYKESVSQDGDVKHIFVREPDAQQ